MISLAQRKSAEFMNTTDNIISYIHTHHDCLSYARDTLGWRVRSEGSRVRSFAPGSHNPSALVIYRDFWYDFKQDLGGDVIDLCAYVRHGGNKGAAIRELAGDFYIESKHYDTRWRAKAKECVDNIDTWHKKLRQADRDYLHSRRITGETIERLKIGFDPVKLQLIFPYFKNNKAVYYIGRDTTGAWKLPKTDPAHRDKYQKATTSKVGDSKEKNAPQDGIFTNIIWGLHTLYTQRKQHTLFDQVQNNDEDEYGEKKPEINFNEWLVIAEGAVDAVTWEQEGFHVIASMGTPFSKWQLKEVIAIARTFKHVLLTYDNDSEGNKFQIKMAKEFFAHNIDFYSAVLPTNLNGHAVKDISDYYCADGNLKELFLAPEKGIDFLSSQITDEDDFYNFALKAARYVDKVHMAILLDKIPAGRFGKTFMKQLRDACLHAPAEQACVQEFREKYKNIQYSINDGFYEYESGRWRKIHDEYIKRYIRDILGKYAHAGRTANIFSALKSELATDEEFNTQHIFNFMNGVLNLDNGQFMPHSPEFMSTIQMNYAYDKAATCEKWLKFIDDTMEGNEKKKLLLQEIAGYIQFADNSLQKCFFLKGEGSNGKSVFIDVLRQVYNPLNCSNVDVSNFGGPFDPIRMRHSLVNFCAEAKVNLKDAESRFKAIVTGDVISAAFKGKDAIEFSPRCKIISACNNFIGSNDTSYGFTRRLVFVNFNKIFRGKNANKNLTAELSEELPGIFNWAYEGYLRLQKNMAFTETDEQPEIFAEFTKNISSVACFVDDEYENLELFPMSPKDLYARYKEWAEKSGYKPQNKLNFIRSFESLLNQQGIRNYKQTKHAGKIEYYLPRKEEKAEALPESVQTDETASTVAQPENIQTPSAPVKQIAIPDFSESSFTKTAQPVQNVDIGIPDPELQTHATINNDDGEIVLDEDTVNFYKTVARLHNLNLDELLEQEKQRIRNEKEQK